MVDYDPNYISKKTFFLVGQKAIILNKKSEILLLLRSEKSGYGGRWSLAGGALEENESPIHGIQREIQEETSLKVTNIQPFSVFSSINEDNDPVFMVGYICMATEEKVTLNWEHDAYQWVTKDKALELHLSEHARFLINEFTVENS